MQGCKRYLKLVAGYIGMHIFPSVVRNLKAGQQTGRAQKRQKAILHAQQHRALRRGDEVASQDLLHQYWQADVSNSFYKHYNQRFDNWFLGPHHELVEELEKLTHTQKFNELVELGCGDGRVLEYCRNKFQNINKYTGIDINPMIIEQNKERYSKDKKLRFICRNAMKWVPERLGSNTVLLTYGGVLEYFTPGSIKKIFSEVAGKGGGAIALVEPVDPKHDLKNQQKSHIFGQEKSFSHNYAHLLKESEFSVLFKKEIKTGWIRWMMILARPSLIPHRTDG